MMRSVRYTASHVACMLLLIPLLVQPNSVLAQVDVGGFVDPEFCLATLQASDANDNGFIDREEYVTFSQLQAPPGLLDDIEFYSMLPVPFQIAFTSLACLCDNPEYGGDPTAAGCCIGMRAAIRIPIDPTGNMEDLLYLFTICARTDAATAIVLTSAAPSLSPTHAPTVKPTVAPTGGPTNPPTLPPTRAPTFRPTLPPTFRPALAPTFGPTLAPTFGPTLPPTLAPTLAPSEVPTNAPVVPGNPTRAPVTGTPTALPTFAPTDTPTASPTVAPTDAPTLSPTDGPTITPTDVPTFAPIVPGAPTRSPVTATPTFAPTATPTIAATPGPTALPLRTLATVVYQIAVRDGQLNTDFISQVEYLSELQVAMNELAVEVSMDTFPPGSRRLLVQRKLAVTVDLPTGFGNVDDFECSNGFGDSTTDDDLCQQVAAEIILALTDEDRANEAEVLARYRADLFQAILSGRLRDIMMAEFPDSEVFILTGNRDQDGGDDSDDGLSSGATAGIAIAVLLVALVPIMYFLANRNRGAPAEVKADYEPYDVSDDNNEVKDAARQESMDISMYTDDAVEGDPANLGASQADYGKVSKSAYAAMEAGEDIVAEPGMDVAPDSSSNAGSSGWSSSAGISSFNTGSVDDSADAAAAAGIGLAVIGASSALSRKIDSDKRAEGRELSDVPGDGSRDNLDNLIEAGDWAAVGATAALLAAASDSQSASSRSRTSRSRNSSSRDTNSIDAARAAELDHLVDAGDWEGVVLAAAKFEAAEGRSGGSGTNSSAGSGSDSNSRSGTDTRGSPSVSTSVSETPSKAAKRAEVRAEVEALVRRVVPEEIDNVDEMMNQFKGREEELVETLRTMQERAVAQKARTAGQKAAKVEARRSVQRGVTPATAARPAGSEGAVTSASSLAVGAVAGVAAGAAIGAAGTSSGGTSASGTTSESGTEESEGQHRSALEMAIEAGDWEAVGEAAAMMGDASVGTASTSEIDRLADANLSQASTGTSRSRRSLEGVTAERAAELDEMIGRGDWTGVVAAAAQFNASDTQSGKKPSTTARSKEEQDALAQAELWMKIAEQKKKEGATDAGASDAAEWAISRSLSQLKEKEAEQQQKKKDEDEDDEDEV